MSQIPLRGSEAGESRRLHGHVSERNKAIPTTVPLGDSTARGSFAATLWIRVQVRTTVVNF